MCSDVHLSIVVDAAMITRGEWKEGTPAWELNQIVESQGYRLDTIAAYFFELLHLENERSLAYRYGDEISETHVGYEPAGERPWNEVMKEIRSCDYQSCEHPEWHDSLAFSILNETFRAMLVRNGGFPRTVASERPLNDCSDRLYAEIYEVCS